MSAEPAPLSVAAPALRRRVGIHGRRRALLVAAGAVAFGLLSEHASEGWLESAYVPILDITIGWLMVACGLIAMDARPRQPAGGRLVVAGYLWFVGGFMVARVPLVAAFGFAFQGWYDLAILLLALAFPRRWPASTPARIVLLVVAWLFAFQAAVRLIWSLPDAAFGTGLDTGFGQVVLWADVMHALGLLAGAAVLGWLLVRLPRGDRRDVAPVLLAGVLSSLAGFASGQYAATTLGLIPEPDFDTVLLAWAINAVRFAVPLAVLLGVLRLRGARSAIAGAVAGVGEAATTAELEAALSTALGDSRLRVLPWEPERRVWRDGDLTLDDDELAALAADGSRAIVPVTAGSEPIAVLVVARSLTDDPALVEAGTALARLVVRTELQAGRIRDQLDEVRASRLRIVEAADVERRRIERDLHDGLQQRMVALAVQLRAAEGGPDQDAALRDGSAEVLAMLEEVRELARGIHAAVLTEAGLGAAVRAIADRSPVPAEVDVSVSGLEPAAVVATAYYVVSEALANVAKHAPAASAAWVTIGSADGRLRVTVEDDGPGGADPRGGGLSGLADRVAALDGSFRVENRPRGGTIVVADLPLP